MNYWQSIALKDELRVCSGQLPLMKLRKITFRILLPSIYFVLALLPVIGLIITIAEGPNPFGFLFFASEPGLRLVDFIDRRLVRLPTLNGWTCCF